VQLPEQERANAEEEKINPPINKNKENNIKNIFLFEKLIISLNFLFI